MAVQTENLSKEMLEQFGDQVVPEVTVFEHINQNNNPGDEDGWSYRTTFRISYIGDDWNDQISSMIVHSGTWRFYEHINFGGAHFDRGPGHHNVPDGWNDRISSFEPISW